MPTFLLKKYNQTKEEHPETDKKEGSQQATEQPTPEDQEKQITISGSISEIVAKTLNKVLSTKGAEVSEVEGGNDEDSSFKAISTEDINSDPLGTFRSISENDVVYISTEGFTTREEEWFLTNLNNKTDKVFYTLESFVNHLVSELLNDS